MAEKYSKDDIEFKEMSEGEAVATFVKDGYDDYTKRSIRYGSNLSSDSEWAKAPAKMFVAFSNDKPVGVVGFSEYKNVLLGAGIHIRIDERKKGLFSILVDKVLSEKGSRTLYINVAKEGVGESYRRKGFRDMQKDELPKDIQEELKGKQYSDQVQKWMEYKAKDAVVNKPIPMSIEGLKVQSTGDKGRTKRSKNFSSEEEWKKVLQKPKNILSKNLLSRDDIKFVNYIMKDNQPRTMDKIYDDIFEEIKKVRGRTGRKVKERGFGTTKFDATRRMLHQYFNSSKKYRIKDLGKDEYGRKLRQYTLIE